MFIKGFPKDLIVGDTQWGVGSLGDTSKRVIDNLADYDCHFDSFRKGNSDR